MGTGSAAVHSVGTNGGGWNHVIPDSAVKILLTLPARLLWMPIRVSGNKPSPPPAADGFAPARETASKDNVDSLRPSIASHRGAIGKGEGLRAGLEIASRVESVAPQPARLGK